MRQGLLSLLLLHQMQSRNVLVAKLPTWLADGSYVRCEVTRLSHLAQWIMSSLLLPPQPHADDHDHRGAVVARGNELMRL